MINKNTQLTLIEFTGVVFNNFTLEGAQYGKDQYTVTGNLKTGGNLYVGFEKPIDGFYLNITTQAGTADSIKAEYYNGTTWVDIDSVVDDTQALFRSGFIRWDRELLNNTQVAVDSITKYWYRFNVDSAVATRNSMVIEGINLVFSDDYELSLENPLINDPEFLGDASSHILYHAASKKEIIQKFRNQNYIKIDPVSGDKEDINCWDLLDIEEVKLASTYLTLSKIYYALSDTPEDVWEVKSKLYEDKFNKNIQLARLSVDIDDDGLVSAGENKPTLTNRFMNR